MSNPLFQYRHYVWLAAFLRDNHLADLVCDSAGATVSDKMAEAFARDNSRFNRGRFMDASNGNPARRDMVGRNYVPYLEGLIGRGDR